MFVFTLLVMQIRHVICERVNSTSFLLCLKAVFIAMLWFQDCGERFILRFTQFRRFYKKKTACVVDKSSNRVTISN